MICQSSDDRCISYLLVKPCTKKSFRPCDSPCNLISQACWGWCKISFEVKALWWFMVTAKYWKVCRFHHKLVLIRRRMLIWCLAIGRIKWPWSRVTVTTRSAATFLHTLSFSNKHRAFETSQVHGQTACVIRTHTGVFSNMQIQESYWIFSMLNT